MAELSPVSWMDLVRRFRRFGFEGPYRGGRHPYMVRGSLVVTIPNPHRREIGTALLSHPQASCDRQRGLAEVVARK